MCRCKMDVGCGVVVQGCKEEGGAVAVDGEHWFAPSPLFSHPEASATASL
jgi:hypothetical protein